MASLDTSDLQQEATFAAWQALSRFDSERASLRTYIDRVVYNRVASLRIAEARRLRGYRGVPIDSVALAAAPQRFELRLDVARVVAAVSAHDRLVARCLGEYSPAAASSCVPEGVRVPPAHRRRQGRRDHRRAHSAARGQATWLREVPVHVDDQLTPAQVKAYRLMDNRSHEETDWDLELLGPELEELKDLDFDLDLTGFDSAEIDSLLIDPEDDERANAVPAVSAVATSRPGDLWLCGDHRVLCGDATDAAGVTRLLDGRKPKLMVTDPPYGIELDSEWRDRAGLNGAPGQPRTTATKATAKANPIYPSEPSYMKHRTDGHHNTSISSDTRADWSEAFELVPSLQVAYVWHASKFTREVLEGLLRIGFIHHQQIIWDKQRTVLTRTLYWFQYEPCWFVRKKNAPWYGKAGENSTIWASPSPKFIMGGSGEEKFDHPTQKPVELMRRPILNHTKPRELVYEPFLGSGTTLAAAELTGRVCCGMELDPKFVDVVVMRWEKLTGKQAVLEDGRTFAAVREERAALRV